MFNQFAINILNQRNLYQTDDEKTKNNQPQTKDKIYKPRCNEKIPYDYISKNKNININENIDENKNKDITMIKAKIYIIKEIK